MIDSNIFTFGIIAVILLTIGLFYTFKEFRQMKRNPEEYRRRHDDVEIADKK